jgi:alkanesulfonate monooxygenase SsuD/methylene tetrahydromethanopterin reductase-like flavin-dependent oxidoreductase (luciferase family)
VRSKDAILREHCAEVGRDESEIERTAAMGVCVIRDDPAEARRVADGIFEHNGQAEPWKGELIGSPEQLVERLRAYLDIGFRTFMCGFPAPYDAESMERLVNEIRPELERG